ncbi:AGE family epimerase/isomerase [Paenibacillus tepidiphilus]|uniref:AGE family epimerase/isomerase n=1 Tax=Paenibacillus tepidiphilus TaxID=2608683 RepID=UPI0012387DAB|nr:AGE family epimerase/isomerase [Paenibacillus tepidiphilus]
MTFTSEQWLKELEAELKDNILGFWQKHTLDEVHGGFLGEIDNNMQVNPQADKSLVLNARILWSFASAYRMYGGSEYLEMAERARAYLMTSFKDREYGGFYWMVDALGAPAQLKKQVYGQSFVIYALAEYYHATGNKEALDEAVALFHLLEKHGYDPEYTGYVEALARDWQPTEELSLSAKDMNEKKSMNTHLHVLEAYTGLYRVWKAEELRAKLAELIGTMIDHIVDAKGQHFHLFLDEAWNVKSETVSFGHDIEGSWLLFEAAEVLSDEAVLQRVRQVAISMAEAVLNEGVAPDGGIWNEAEPHGLASENKDWWPQAEAVVGFYNAYQLTGEAKYLEASQAAWSFIRNHLADPEHGEWFWGVDKDLKPLAHEPKISAWKCPYHNSRACFELIARLNSTAKESHV